MTVIARPCDSHPGNRQPKKRDPCGAPFQEIANNNGASTARNLYRLDVWGESSHSCCRGSGIGKASGVLIPVSSPSHLRRLKSRPQCFRPGTNGLDQRRGRKILPQGAQSMPTDRPIGYRRFSDDTTRPVFLDQDGRQYIFNDGRPCHGVWLDLQRTDNPSDLVPIIWDSLNCGSG
jgi:hypothetical protein